ncbi:helix-turn-helix domain-containing protein [Bifidobacterium moukalabense]|uniref:helix-turn-helix domain-containing protein n=1 Tax=Bifidobacterium moukalabense TaxID=1333651 RepID=UPI0010F80B28|nr:helix-turn-helix domain-containing protein [Bifidobacterium moukalabense]
MGLPVIDAVVSGDRPFVIQGYGRTYEMTEAEFNAAMRAADAVSGGAGLLTTGEAAELLGVSARTVARLVDAGRIPARRLSDTGHRMVEYRDVMAYRELRARRGRLLEDARALASDMGAYDGADGSADR